MTQLTLPGVPVPEFFVPHGQYIEGLDRTIFLFEDVSYVERTYPNGVVLLHANHDPHNRVVGYVVEGWAEFPIDAVSNV